MNGAGIVFRLTIIVTQLILAGSALRATAAPLGSGFTYQGQLQQDNVPATSMCDFQFGLWDAAGSGAPPSGGNQVGGAQAVNAVRVTNGLFTVQLNDGAQFGPNAFAGDDRWLQIDVRCPSGGGAYTTLAPRQELTAAPYALYAPSAASAAAVNCSGCLSTNAIATGAVTSDKIANGTIQVADLGFTVGTVTSITAGVGLTGGTITTNGTVAANIGTTAGSVAAGDHNHLGQNWTGSLPGDTGLVITNFSSAAGSAALVGFQGVLADTAGAGGAAGLPIGSPVGVAGTSVHGNGVAGQTYSSAAAGVFGGATDGRGVEGRSGSGTAVYGTTLNGIDGVYGQSDRSGFLTGGNGVHGVANGAFSNGVRGESTNGRGVFGSSDGGTGVSGTSATGNGLFASSGGTARNDAALRATNTNSSGGIAAYLTNSSNFATAHVSNAGGGEVLYLENGGTDGNGSSGGDFIKCVNNPENDAQLRVLTSGEVRSDVGFNTPAADFAEMLPAIDGLEPGDVLAVGLDGQLTRTGAPHQTNVVGVYSTSPGFVGGKPMEGEAPGTVPLAVVGVVPVKASAENGPIHPGDLLAASSIPGHAMAAGPLPAVGTVIGKSLAQLAGGTGVIRMLVTLQ